MVSVSILALSLSGYLSLSRALCADMHKFVCLCACVCLCVCVIIFFEMYVYIPIMEQYSRVIEYCTLRDSAFPTVL